MKSLGEMDKKDKISSKKGKHKIQGGGSLHKQNPKIKREGNA